MPTYSDVNAENMQGSQKWAVECLLKGLSTQPMQDVSF